MEMPQASSPSSLNGEKKKKVKKRWQAVAVDATKSTPKRPRSEEEVSDEDEADGVMEVEIGLLKSINDRLAKLNVLEVMMKDLNQLKASLEYSQWQIDELLSDNRNLKKSVQDMESRVNVLEKENKRLSETLLDQQCRSMRNNLVF
ncbi:hypothetical protein ABVT39_007066 [Epinephelus coioides]